MKKYNVIFTIFALFLVQSTLVFGQIAFAPVLMSYSDGNYITIQVRNNTTFSSHFNPVGVDSVTLDFHFMPDDPRNGINIGKVSNGPVIASQQTRKIKFENLRYDSLPDLTFAVTETFLDGTIKIYKFHRGELVEDAPIPISVCPTSVSCNLKSIAFYFNLADIQLTSAHAGIPVTLFFGEGSPYNVTYPLIHDVNISSQGNFLLFRGISNFPCTQVLTGTFTVIIGDLVCTFNNGVLQSSHCSPYSGYYPSNPACGVIFETCHEELDAFLLSIRPTIRCSQWSFHQTCGTSHHTTRTGSVAIGTSTPASGALLTVKNGIISDKVYVQRCETGGWCDYVFDDNYPLMPLEQVEAYVQAYQHLPGIPSAATIEKEGSIEVGEVTFQQQEKLEEIFLHLIDLDREITILEAEIFILEWTRRPI